MPAASQYTTKEFQEKLMHGIQDVLVVSFNRVNSSKHLLGIFWALKDIIGVAYRLWKLGTPTHDTVRTHNAHVLVDLRDWILDHDRSARREFYEVFFNLVIIKYEFDGHMGKRLEKFFEKFLESDWIVTGKHPETEWVMTEEEKQEPTYRRQQALQQALNDKDWAKALNYID
uniref:Uncharacterized protein n=1 Tax=viral metagenome TaxID=1070528 RepID=A0A6M3J2Z0_9ZZZZ